MTDRAGDLFLQYALKRGEILAIADRLMDALEEDHRVNADMFDIHRLTFSQNKHPNKTMRALEADLQNADLSLLCLLSALSDIGMEKTQHLRDLSDPAVFADCVAALYEELMAIRPDPPYLAQKLTEIKAEHALKRLRTAILTMEANNR
ncbi:MAG: hypothetical protein E7590_07615 [Ruminococcaceae bacterium]|nr:hypothetical protein [Oscillospiraceae bacterium]